MGHDGGVLLPGRRVEAQKIPGLPLEPSRARRYKTRTQVERFFARLKVEFGGRMIFVRGNRKVMAHLMYGVLAILADQVLGSGS